MYNYISTYTKLHVIIYGYTGLHVATPDIIMYIATIGYIITVTLELYVATLNYMCMHIVHYVMATLGFAGYKPLYTLGYMWLNTYVHMYVLSSVHTCDPHVTTCDPE